MAGQKCLDREKAREGRAFISAKELRLMGKKPCLFVAYDDSPARYGPEAVAKDEIKRYGSGYFPVLERLSYGWVKTVDRLDAPDGWYTVVYFPVSALSSKWEKTAFGIHEGNYDIQPNVPELCPIPEGAKKKQTPSPPTST